MNNPKKMTLAETIFSLIPADGSSIGNGRLRDQLSSMGHYVDEDTYSKIRNDMIRSRVLRIGRGRGGTVRRTVCSDAGTIQNETEVVDSSCHCLLVDSTGKGEGLSKVNLKAPADSIKANGVHYTPDHLCDFMAKLAIDRASTVSGPLSVLDPACGDGALLRAIGRIGDTLKMHTRLIGVDIDAGAIEKARECLSGFKNATIEVSLGDYLKGGYGQATIFDDRDSAGKQKKYDVIISNPPYVRTQNIGDVGPKELSSKFGLDGRVDLYHAFIVKAIDDLKDGGVMVFVTSNRFMVTNAGEQLRKAILTRLKIEEVIDFGDTKIFDAAVLPVVFVGVKVGTTVPAEVIFRRIYETRRRSTSRTVGSIYEAIESQVDQECVCIGEINYVISRGTMGILKSAAKTWYLARPSSAPIIDKIFSIEHKKVGEIFNVRVGIKTTADNVFIRDGWSGIEESKRPEDEVIYPLFTSDNAARWTPNLSRLKSILYTHLVENGRRTTIPLDKYPGAKAYLTDHREQLEGRKYVVKAKRDWFEIWVPQDPSLWSHDKIVFPDISTEPKFSFIPASPHPLLVNGDCYYIIVNKNLVEEALLMLGIINSKLSVFIYDELFNNKLYSGKRRFITQYIQEYPIPNPASLKARKVVDAVRGLINHSANGANEAEQSLNTAVYDLFNLSSSEQAVVEKAERAS